MSKFRSITIIGAIALATGFLAISADAENFEGRIARQQAKSGNRRAEKKLTAAESARADNRDYKLNQEEFAMKSRHNGKLTRRDQIKLNRQMRRNQRIMNNETGRGKK